jgi:hypothetical protein
MDYIISHSHASFFVVCIPNFVAAFTRAAELVSTDKTANVLRTMQQLPSKHLLEFLPFLIIFIPYSVSEQQQNLHIPLSPVTDKQKILRIK